MASLKRLPTDTVVTLVLLGTAVATAAVGVYLPQARALAGVRSDIATRTLAMESDARVAATVPVMAKQVEEMKKRYQGFDRKMPKQKELAGFLTELSRILGSQRLATRDYRPGDPRKERFYHTLPIIMKLEGPYLSLTSFLRQIDGMERLARIQMLKVQKDPKKKGQDLDIELQMNIYFTES
jgi:Tfp pilus assembly protein PilO